MKKIPTQKNQPTRELFSFLIRGIAAEVKRGGGGLAAAIGGLSMERMLTHPEVLVLVSIRAGTESVFTLPVAEPLPRAAAIRAVFDLQAYTSELVASVPVLSDSYLRGKLLLQFALRKFERV